MRRKTVLLCLALLCVLLYFVFEFTKELKFEKDVPFISDESVTAGSYIKWIDFGVSYSAMKDAMKADISSHGTDNHHSWVMLLSCLAVKSGGNFSSYSKSRLDKIITDLNEGKSPVEICGNEKLYNYYFEAYSAILSSMVGEYTAVTVSADGSEKHEQKYGFRVFSPIANGYYYTDYDDFGASRSYGYKREHLGHDMLGSVGTPIIATESGVVEACGWNAYGGWRIGIRSFDGKRYYYYAHLRRGHPYNNIYEGKTVFAGEVIGYLGCTGYSTREDTNNIDTPHLHFGLQIIFDGSQKDGTNQIWIDMYALTRLLSENKAKVSPKDANNDRHSLTYYIYPEMPD